MESGKVDLSECTKLSLDERLVAPDQHVRPQNFRNGESAETVGALEPSTARPLKVGAKIYTNMHCNWSKTKIIGHIIG